MIFFEYAPHFLDLGAQGRQRFWGVPNACQLVLRGGHFYQNQGDFMIGLVLSETDAIRDLHHHVGNAWGSLLGQSRFLRRSRDLVEHFRHGER